MEEEIKKLQQEVIELQNTIKILIEKINKITDSTERMDSHIDFVEQTYSVLRTPIDYIRKQFDSSDKSLPKLGN